MSLRITGQHLDPARTVVLCPREGAVAGDPGPSFALNVGKSDDTLLDTVVTGVSRVSGEYRIYLVHSPTAAEAAAGKAPDHRHLHVGGGETTFPNDYLLHILANWRHSIPSKSVEKIL